ncbi:hypothetical protein [Vibrio phage vB_VmeM-Yong XC32]|nr:hypothetical protein [Vibrio phage vB_VmeM-Yong XC31]QAX96454.1 hypothetical protein [Vibrio phage vB_VmeM-Yong XC32]QAX96771.1 hypothetical protein [Vibrio phage vB_VmeM-Yong MS31]QAX97090.1 hypothetical protein [Vibrio phage vB_VmeM-Yong MS32]
MMASDLVRTLEKYGVNMPRKDAFMLPVKGKGLLRDLYFTGTGDPGIYSIEYNGSTLLIKAWDKEMKSVTEKHVFNTITKIGNELWFNRRAKQGEVVVYKLTY